MKPEAPSLRLLREVHRIERIAFAHPEPVDPVMAWALVRDTAATEEDAPGWLDRLLLPRTHRPLPRAYGEVVRFQRSPFFVTAPVPFTGIVLRDGGVAVAFRATVRGDLAPVVLRFAAERLWAAEGWRFPEDLVRREAFEAVRELAFGGDPWCRFRLPEGAAPRGEAAEVAVETIDPPPHRRSARVTLFWEPRMLGFRFERQGLF